MGFLFAVLDEVLAAPEAGCVLGLLLVTAVMRSCGRGLARRVAQAMLVSSVVWWEPIAVLRRVARTAGPVPVRAWCRSSGNVIWDCP